MGKWIAVRHIHMSGEQIMVRISLAIYLTIVALSASWQCPCIGLRIQMASELPASISSKCPRSSCTCALSLNICSDILPISHCDWAQETRECSCSVHGQAPIGMVKSCCRLSRQLIGSDLPSSYASWVLPAGGSSVGPVQLRLIGSMVANQKSRKGTELRVVFHILRC
jgi:hypothetical protein